MSITKINNLLELAQARMLQQFKADCAPELDKLLSVLIAEGQEVEDQLFKLRDERSVDNAVGAQLDTIADIVGIDREGRTDPELNDLISVQIQVNSTGGQEPALASLIDVLTVATVIDILEVFPAGLDIFINNNDLSVATVRLFRRAIAATVGLQFAQVAAGETAFAFAGSSVGDGFGNLVTPTDGGVFAFVISED